MTELKNQASPDRITFGKGQKWSFAGGSFAQWFVNSAFNTWVFSFYFYAVELPVIYIMSAYILWTIWNAVNDPLIGYLSDRVRTRWGRRKPFIMLGTIPVIMIEIILWIPPTMNYFVTFLYLLIILFAYDTFYSMIALPYDSLFPELYTSVKERAEVNTYKQILSIIGIILAFLVPGIFIADLTLGTGYLINGIVTSIIIGITLVVSIKYGVIEREEFSLDHKQDFGFVQGLKYTFKNKGFILYTIMFFLYEYVLLVLTTVTPSYGREILGATPFETSIILAVMMLVGVATVIVWQKLDVKFGSRIAFGISIIVYIISSLPILFIESYMLALVTVIFMGFGFGGMLYFIYLLIADVVDEDELKTGVRREGAFFGITNFFMRLAMIMSIVSVGLVFTTRGWEEYVPLNPENREAVFFGIRMLMVIFPAIALGLTLVCLYFYPFPKEKVQKIKVELEKMHKEKLDRVKKHSSTTK